MPARTIAVIGGGPAGLMAAVTAAATGADVVVLEHNDKPGRKLLATGNGQCNFTNVHATPADYNHPAFVAPAFAAFGPDHAVAFFEALGIPPRIEADGRAYPLSLQASSILAVLLEEAERLGVRIRHGFPVTAIQATATGFVLTGGMLGGETVVAERVILATGGMALPKSGSDGSGYALARALGHVVTPLFPSLTKLTIDSPHLRRLEGVKVEARIRLYGTEGLLGEEEGDLLFMKYGVSGPGVLQLSRRANERIAHDEPVELSVTLVTALTHGEVLSRFDALRHKTAAAALVGLVHAKLIPALLADAKLLPDALVRDLAPQERGRLVKLLFDWRFRVTGCLGFDDAQTTAGGIDLAGIDPTTLASTTVPGLHFAGEVLDVDARCGGFNLQWAWASGHVAGLAATR